MSATSAYASVRIFVVPISANALLERRINIEILCCAAMLYTFGQTQSTKRGLEDIGVLSNVSSLFCVGLSRSITPRDRGFWSTGLYHTWSFRPRCLVSAAWGETTANSRLHCRLNIKVLGDRSLTSNGGAPIAHVLLLLGFVLLYSPIYTISCC